MKAPFRLLFSTTLALSLTVASGLSPIPGMVVTAKEPAIAAVQFNRPTPPDRGTPGNAGRGGGSRSCLELASTSDNQVLNGLNALVPEYQREKSVDVWGLTMAEHPTVWFYIPFTSKSIQAIELTVQDAQGNTIQKVPVAIPKQPGIVPVQLATSQPGLQAGQLYNWFFKVHGNCADNLVVFVEGWIERTNPDAALTAQLDQASPTEKIALLAKRGIWYDALTAAASQPNAATLWKELLQQTDMGALASQPLLKP